jgi:hypothetical protein
MQRILIVGHERSGNHLLVESIYSNFKEYEAVCHGGVWDLPWYVDPSLGRLQAAEEWLVPALRQDPRTIYKTHHLPSYLSAVEDVIKNDFKVFYIYRDGRDVLTSFWRYLGMQMKTWGDLPAYPSAGDLMRSVPQGRFVKVFQDRSFDDMLDRWMHHVARWGAVGWVTPIRYEDLLEDFEGVISNVIAPALEREPSPASVRPELETTGHFPWRGEAGTWKEFFTNEDVEFFLSRASSMMRALGYEA